MTRYELHINELNGPKVECHVVRGLAHAAELADRLQRKWTRERCEHSECQWQCLRNHTPIARSNWHG